MNPQDFIQQIQASEISEERKQKIIALVTEKGLDFDTKEEVKAIIQEDIESDAATILTDADRAEIQKASDELGTELSAIEKTVSEDLAFVETEMKDLQTTVDGLGKSVDAMEIDSLKAKLRG